MFKWFIFVFFWGEILIADPLHFSWNVQSEANIPELQMAHIDYARGKFDEMVKNLITTMEKHNDEITTENVLLLLAKAYELNKKISIRSNWKELGFITQLEIVLRRLESEQVVLFQTEIRGVQDEKQEIQNLTLSTKSGKIFLEKKSGLGRWNIYRGKRSDKRHNFFLTSEASHRPMADDLYVLKFAFKNGVQAQDKIIINSMTSGSSPEVLFPTRNANLNERRPRIRWNDFYSAAYQEYETRNVSIAIIRTETGNRQDIKERVGPFWGAFLPPTMMSIQFGTRYENGIGFGEPELRDGRYLLELAFAESRQFGETKLVRESVKQVPFTFKSTP